MTGLLALLTFANPLGLIGLLTLPGIVLLHALRARSRRIVVPSLGLWSFLEKEVHGNRLSQVPITPLLILHLLIAALLSLAWANPQLNLPVVRQEARHVIVLLDVSTSMRAADSPPDRFTQARQLADRLFTDMGPSDVGTLIIFGVNPRWVADTRSGTNSDLHTSLQSIQQVETTQAGAKTGESLEHGLALAYSALEPDMLVEIHVMTDGAYPEPPSLNAETKYPITWHIIGSSPSGNQAVLDIAARQLSPTRTQVFARLANFSPTPTTREVILFADGSPVENTIVDLDAQSTLSYLWEIMGAPSSVGIELAGADDLQEDDMAFTGLPPPRRAQVGVFAAGTQPVNDLLDAIQSSMGGIEQEPYQPGKNYDFVIAWGSAPEPLPVGTILILQPEGAPVREIANQLMLQTPQSYSSLAGATTTEDPSFWGVDFTGLRQAVIPIPASLPPGFQILLSIQSGSEPSLIPSTSSIAPLLLRGQVEQSQIYLFLPHLTNLSGDEPVMRHPALPIMVANLIEIYGSKNFPPDLVLGEPMPLFPSSQYPRAALFSGDGMVFEWGMDRPVFYESLPGPGFYQASFTDIDNNILVYPFGVNAGSMSESDISPHPWAVQLAESSTSPGDPPPGESQVVSIDLIPWLLLLVGFLLFLEAWLAWR